MNEPEFTVFGTLTAPHLNHVLSNGMTEDIARKIKNKLKQLRKNRKKKTINAMRVINKVIADYATSMEKQYK